MKAIHFFYILVVLVIFSLFTSCEYEFIEVYTPVPPNPADTIHFQADIVPIFESSSCTACHKPGGLAPFSLTAPDAYNSITDNNLVVPGDPENSIIYTYPNPQTGAHHHYKSSSDVNLIYGWISQGALDN